MKLLVIGLGSIAHKHILALRKLNPDCEVYALRSSQSSPEIEDVISCYSLDEIPLDIRFILISNPTSLHLKTIEKVSRLGVPLFIEKPPVDSLNQIRDLKSFIKTMEISTYTAFNLRFHPVIQWLKANIDVSKVIEVNAYCGSYLPLWRPEKDYRKVYSARKELGGGVHLDLSHEIDYLLWIFGKPITSNSRKRKISNLEIDSVDSAKYWIEYETFTINLTLNYFRKDPKRLIEIVTLTTTLECDLLSYTVTDLLTSKVVFRAKSSESCDTYHNQMKYFIDCIEAETKPMNSLMESLKTMEICLK